MYILWGLRKCILKKKGLRECILKNNMCIIDLISIRDNVGSFNVYITLLHVSLVIVTTLLFLPPSMSQLLSVRQISQNNLQLLIIIWGKGTPEWHFFSLVGVMLQILLICCFVFFYLFCNYVLTSCRQRMDPLLYFHHSRECCALTAHL